MAIAEPTRTDPPTTARATTPAETRARLLEAAIDVFLENGYARTRVQDIARRAGLTTGAMYAHFKNKAALLSEAIAVHGDIALNELVDAMGSDQHCPAALTVGVRALSGEGRPVDRLLLEALAVTARGDENEDLIGPALQRMRELLRRRELPIVIGWSFFPLAPTDLICYVCGSLGVDVRKMLAGILVGEGIICALYIFLGRQLLSFLF